MTSGVVTRADQEPVPAPSAPLGATKGSWRGSWRPALRMARREIRRARGRSILVLVMVLLPVAVFAYAVTGIETYHGRDYGATFGSAQASISGPQDFAVAQDAALTVFGSSEVKARPIPGWQLGDPLSTQSKALTDLIGSKTVPFVVSGERVKLDESRKARAIIVSVPPDANLGTKVELTSGRWPVSPEEVLVTPRGERDGIPSSGELTLSLVGSERSVRVVGTGRGFTERETASLISAPPEVAPLGAEVTWLVTGKKPISWAKVRELNTFGLIVLSRHVLDHPPADSAIDPSVRGAGTGNNSALVVIATGSVLIFLLAAMMVAPAFAVGAARQRRTLALIASNGAETRQLRRMMLAQAVVLGALGAVLGVALGVVAMVVHLGVVRYFLPWLRVPPLDVPVGTLMVIGAVAIVSTLAAALLPATRLGRLDIVRVMKGMSVSPPPRYRLAVLGAALVVGGGATVIGAFATRRADEVVVLVSTLVMVAGAVLTVPSLLVLAGRVATRAPLSVRLAARDAARHRTRAVPTVAAIMAGAALLTTIGIAVSSDDAQERRDYEPSLAAGEGTISWDAALDPDGDDIITTLGVVAPSLRHFLVGEVGQDWSAPVDEGTGEPVVMALPAGCSLEESMTGLDSGAGGCALAGTHASVPIGRGDVVLGAPIQVLPAAELARLYDLSSADRAAVARGALLSASPLLGNTTSVELVIGSLPIDAEGLQHDVSVSRRVSVPAVSLDPETADNNGRAASTFLSTEAVERLALPLRITGMQIYDPTGPITSAVKRSIQEQLDDYSYLYVELGYTSPMKWLIRGLFGAAGLLILVVTLIATALAVSEQQADLGTLAAVGASRGTRRRMAATQAWLISFIGVALGIILGFMPGIGYTFPLTVPDYINTGNGGRIITDDRVGDPVIVVPWLGLLLVLVVVPLVAAAIAAVAIRRAPGLTRRGD